MKKPLNQLEGHDNTDNKFSLGTSADGLSLVVQSKFEEDDDPIFVVKNNANQNVLEVLPDGNIQAPLGSFQIDATQLDNLDLSNFDNLQTRSYSVIKSLLAGSASRAKRKLDRVYS